MANRSVLAALSHITGMELRFFELVHCNARELDEVDELYLCLGKHCLVFLDRAMEGAPDGFFLSFPFPSIDSLRADATDSELFEITFQTSQRSIAIKCPARNQILDNIEICYNTDFMYQNWKVPLHSEHPLQVFSTILGR